LESSISATMHATQPLAARVMQDVALPSGKIRAGSTVAGHIVSIAPATNGNGPRVTFTFDRIESAGRMRNITTGLRAMASFVEVNNAMIPVSGADRGTPDTERTTLLVGGDVDYRQDGPVVEGSRVVGRPTFDGVLSEANNSDCSTSESANRVPQSLWVFSADACGLYGLRNLSLEHVAGPIDQISIQSNRREIKIAAGAGLLLCVIAG
jgi:hypothetical protein